MLRINKLLLLNIDNGGFTGYTLVKSGAKWNEVENNLLMLH